MGAGTSKIPNLKNLSSTDLIEIQKSIPDLINRAKEREAKPTSPKSATPPIEEYDNEAQAEPEGPASSPTGGGKKRRQKTKKYRKKRMKKTEKK
jgi:hypothetical protein